jgi:hypothetical protein
MILGKILTIKIAFHTILTRNKIQKNGLQFLEKFHSQSVVNISKLVPFSLFNKLGIECPNDPKVATVDSLARAIVKCDQFSVYHSLIIKVTPCAFVAFVCTIFLFFSSQNKFHQVSTLVEQCVRKYELDDTSSVKDMSPDHLHENTNKLNNQSQKKFSEKQLHVQPEIASMPSPFDIVMAGKTSKAQSPEIVFVNDPSDQVLEEAIDILHHVKDDIVNDGKFAHILKDYHGSSNIDFFKFFVKSLECSKQVKVFFKEYLDLFFYPMSPDNIVHRISSVIPIKTFELNLRKAFRELLSNGTLTIDDFSSIPRERKPLMQIRNVLIIRGLVDPLSLESAFQSMGSSGIIIICGEGNCDTNHYISEMIKKYKSAILVAFTDNTQEVIKKYRFAFSIASMNNNIQKDLSDKITQIESDKRGKVIIKPVTLLKKESDSENSVILLSDTSEMISFGFDY